MGGYWIGGGDELYSRMAEWGFACCSGGSSGRFTAIAGGLDGQGRPGDAVTRGSDGV
jgi:hypothetical protein